MKNLILLKMAVCTVTSRL